MSVNAPTGSKSGSGSKVESFFFFFLAFLCLIFWVSVLALSIQISESIFGGPTLTSLRPNLDIITQPYDFFFGNLPANMLAPVLVGWPVTIFELLFVFNFEKTLLHARKYNTRISGIAIWFAIGAFVYDFITNILSPLVPGNFWLHLVFALVMTGVEIVLPIGLIACTKHGVDVWS